MESLHYGAIIRLQGIMSCFHTHTLLYIQYKAMESFYSVNVTENMLILCLNFVRHCIMLNPVKQNEQKIILNYRD